MPNIKHYIANSTGELDPLIKIIDKSLDKIIPVAEEDLNANQIDIIFVSAPLLAIPEYGIGGNSPGPNHVYISFDPKSDKITQSGIEESLLHEIHHCMRWRDPGYGMTLGEALISEGLACLYEEQKSGNVPLYAEVNVNKKTKELAKKEINSNEYNHSDWFFGSKEIVRWFGYSYGYQLSKAYSEKTDKSAAELVHTPAKTILKNIV